MSLIKWKVKDVVDIIDGCVKNKFDCIIMIEGNRGLGKSTLGYLLAIKCRKRGLTFRPEKHMVYGRKETLRLLATKQKTVILSDEMINVGFNRDFYEQDQKLLVKALNLYRDSCNAFIGCIPSFANLDTNLRYLCKMRITVKHRGIALIQVPLRGTFLPDRWDTASNIKQEIKTPKSLNKFSTVRGILHFKDLTSKQRVKYERLKKLNRGKVFDENLDLKEMDPQQQMIEKIYNKVVSGEATQKYLLDSAELVGKKYTGLCVRLNQMLKDNGKPTVSKLLKDEEKEKIIDPRKFI